MVSERTAGQLCVCVWLTITLTSNLNASRKVKTLAWLRKKRELEAYILKYGKTDDK